MHLLSVANLKGGSGKTALVTNLAPLLRDAGPRTLVWDLDPQGNATEAFGHVVGADDPTVAQLLLGEATLAEVIVPLGEGLAVVPAAGDLADVADLLGGKAAVVAAGRAMFEAAADAGWQLSICDTHPDESAPTTLAVRWADVILGAANAQDGNSTSSLERMMEYIERTGSEAVVRILVTRGTPPRKGWRRRATHDVIHEALAERWGDRVLETAIVESADMHKATVGAGIVSVVHPDSLVADQFRRAAAELLPLLQTPED